MSVNLVCKKAQSPVGSATRPEFRQKMAQRSRNEGAGSAAGVHKDHPRRNGWRPSCSRAEVIGRDLVRILQRDLAIVVVVAQGIGDATG